MQAPIRRQLGMEGGRQHPALADRDRMAVPIAGQHLHLRADLAHDGGEWERRERFVSQRGDLWSA